MEKAKEIHSNSQASPGKQRKAALKGLFDTVVTVAEDQEIKDISKSSRIISHKVIPHVVNDMVRDFEKCDDNLNRSILTLYTGGLISKTKYNSIRSSLMFKLNSTKKSRSRLKNGVLIPKLLDYKALMKFIRSIDIGLLKAIRNVDTEDNDDNSSESSSIERRSISGCYVDLEWRVLQVAKFYLSIDKTIPILKWFGRAPGSFFVTIGGDGAPFGKENQATSWLISFLNVETRVASCDDNFLILGANCSEEHPAMIKYAKQLRTEMESIEKKVYSIQDHENMQVRFSFELVPSDMKFLATFSGELSNSATFPSSFANVKLDELGNVKGSLGSSPGCTWNPWSYNDRVKVAKQVSAYKHTTVIKKPVKQHRNLITKFIANQASRQEFEPVLGPVIAKAVCEPLHLGNNCWQQWNKEAMIIALKRSNIASGVGNVYMLPFDCCFRRYLRAIRNKLKCRKLCNKIVRWFRECNVKEGGRFQSRFTGEETRKFCSNFMHVIDAIASSDISEHRENLNLYALAYSGLKLRDITSAMNRIIDIDETFLLELEKNCTEYFTCSSLFLGNVTLSMWTVGFCVPYHSSTLFKKFGVGLGINTMQGREAKHQRLANYANFALAKDRWEKVFMHEHMSLIWLRQQNPYLIKYNKSKATFIPSRCSLDAFCYCGLLVSTQDGKCTYCDSLLMKNVSKCVVLKKVIFYLFPGLASE